MRARCREAPDLHALFMATLTLTRMAEGGMYDQLGGGFARYSVDQYWMIPHFEKMLYDNGALLASYAEAALATGDALFRRITTETGEWLLREMHDLSERGRLPFGLRRRLGRPRGQVLRLDARGSAGRTHARRVERFQPPLRFRRRRRISKAPGTCTCSYRSKRSRRSRISKSAEVERRIDSARAKLLAIRSRRVWPGLDDKILTSWNALAIRGLGIAARVARHAANSARPPGVRWISCAPTPGAMGRLLATSKDGVSHLNAYLDDYAYLANALLEMLQFAGATKTRRWLREILDAMLRAFRGPTTRRILLHLGRSRGADPSQQEFQRRRHSRRQWHRGARPDPRRLPARRDRAGWKPRSARCAPRGWRSIVSRTDT